jgi:tRNA pseudouridine55 synthase
MQLALRNEKNMDEAVLVIDKTAGPSSFDVVRKVRNYVRIKKVGHAGSLDPFATGVLVLLTGKATKLSNALLNADKKYQAVIKLGESTDSMDCTGQVVETMPIPELTEGQVREVLKAFEGEWSQIPPMFSAKKVQGVRLYELARKNISIKREPIPVQLYQLELLNFGGGYLKFQVHCSKGTYVRSLADEIARRLGTVGHLTELRRLTCGNFSLEESVTVDQLVAGAAEWKAQGHRNYLKLLSAEGLIRTHNAGFEASRSSHLPRHGNNDMSFLN